MLDYPAKTSCGRFPSATWGADAVEFLVSRRREARAGPAAAAVLFAIQDSRFVVANIEGRGWCVPGGHIEPGESALQAVRREAFEEAGLILGRVWRLGSFHLNNRASSEVNVVPAYLARVTRTLPLEQFSESRGMAAFTLAELPGCYYMWDPLLASVFQFAWERFLDLSRKAALS